MSALVALIFVATGSAGLILRVEGPRGFMHFFDARWVRDQSKVGRGEWGPLWARIGARAVVIVGAVGFILALAAR